MALPLLQLDLRRILTDRIPKGRGRWIPSPVYRGLESLIRQKQLNTLLRDAYPAEGCAFAGRIMQLLDIDLRVSGLESIPPGRYAFASNHPLGGLDGLALLDVLGKKFGPDKVKFPVNDMLLNVTPLSTVFVPINKYGAQGRDAARALNDAFASDAQIAIFPSGLVSRIGDDGRIADLKWHKTFAAKALEYGRDIVPVYIDALNRRRFYVLAHLRRQLGIKVNIEQLDLPAELCASRGMRIEIAFGQPVSISDLRAADATPVQITRHIRTLSDRLGKSSG